jgi:hypothetical protein
MKQGYEASTNLATLRQTEAANLANLISGAGEAQAAGLATQGAIQAGREQGQGQVLGGILGGLGNIYGLYRGGAFDTPSRDPLGLGFI